MFVKNAYCILFLFLIEYLSNADMVELADTSDLGSDALGVQVQVLLSAPFKIARNSDFFVCKLSFRIIFILLQFFTVFYNSLLFYISFTVLYCLKKLLCPFETQELFSKANLPSMSLNKLYCFLLSLAIYLYLLHFFIQIYLSFMT